MRHDKFKLATLALVCFLFTMSAPHASFCQEPPKPQPPAEPRKADAKKPEVKKIEVHVKVSAQDGKPLPSRVVIEVSGKEKACGSLNLKDAMATVDGKDEAVFNLPVCKVTVKANVPLYLQVVKPIDLVDYKSAILLTLEREQ